MDLELLQSISLAVSQVRTVDMVLKMIVSGPHKAIIYSCTKWQDAVLEQLRAALLRDPHHIEGAQYLLINVWGPNRELTVHWITIPHSGNPGPGDLEVRRLPGSPYKWGGDDRRPEALPFRP